jgi:hypothetical protein
MKVKFSTAFAILTSMPRVGKSHLRFTCSDPIVMTGEEAEARDIVECVDPRYGIEVVKFEDGKCTASLDEADGGLVVTLDNGVNRLRVWPEVCRLVLSWHDASELW